MRVRKTLGLFGSFALAAVADFALALNATTEAFHAVRLGVVLLILVALHLARYPRFVFSRESVLYGSFVVYMFVALLWTADVRLAVNTLAPALNFVLILILFGALVTYHDLRAVLAGALAGFLAGAAYYTATEGFPFVRPDVFSYNAIAVMYSFGLFITLVIGWYTRSTLLPALLALLLLLLIVATTSIKTNLGILLGLAAAGLISYKSLGSALRRSAIPLIALAVVLAYAIASNEALIERFDTGIERVGKGVKILQAREDRTTTTEFEDRGVWLSAGLKGWAGNPLFGHGVEAFRDRYGATSHSTPIDLLYNFGLIGFLLYYAIFIYMSWRIFRARDAGLGGLRALIVGGLVCLAFITLSGTMIYNSFLAAFIAISVGLLRQRRAQASRVPVAAAAAHP